MTLNNLKIIKDSLSKKPREGYVKRGIPEECQEDILSHCDNVKYACMSLIKGNPNMVEKHIRFINMGGKHDYIEWGDTPDITPTCNYTEDEKLKIEIDSALNISKMIGKGGKYLGGLLLEYIKQETNDSKILTLLDKLDPGIRCLEYEKLGFGELINDFEPYVLKKLEGNEYLLNIYKILLEREFQDINYFYQYFLLLELGGDKEKFREEIVNRKNNLVEKIKELQKINNNIFYNSKGNQEAYKLCVRHLSSSTFVGLTYKSSKNTLTAKDEFFIVDFENLDLIKIHKGDKVDLVELKNIDD